MIMADAMMKEKPVMMLRMRLAEWVIAMGFALLPQCVRRVHAAALFSHHLRTADTPELDEWFEEVRAVLRGDATVPR